MIIHHYYPHGHNIGDRFARDGIRKLLRERSPGATIVDFPVNKSCPPGVAYGLRGENVERNNAEADLVVIGGSNLYQCRKRGPWGVATDVESIQRLSRPVMLIGLGTGSSFKNTVRPCLPPSSDEIRLLNQRAVGSSVRDKRTEAFLTALGLRGQVMTGCPSTFVFEKDLAFNDHLDVAVSFPPVRFKKRHPWTYFRVIRAIRKHMDYCLGQGLRPFLACHDRGDLELAKEISRGRTELFFSENTEDYYARYANIRLLVGFRLHASIICLSMGVPFIPVSFDLRGTAFLEAYDSIDWGLDGTSWRLGKDLIGRTRQILARQSGPFEKLFACRRQYAGVIRQFVAGCLAKAGA